jgi:hypothetical protein
MSKDGARKAYQKLIRSPTGLYMVSREDERTERRTTVSRDTPWVCDEDHLAGQKAHIKCVGFHACHKYL